MASLRDALVKAGLVSKKKADEVEKEKQIAETNQWLRDKIPTPNTDEK